MCNEYMLITNIRYGILVITMFNCTCQVSSIMCEKQTVEILQLLKCVPVLRSYASHNSSAIISCSRL